MTEENSKGRGGAGRGQGRKPVKVGEVTIPVTIRLLPIQQAKLHRLGGGKRVRQWIDKAKEPKGQKSGEAE